ncbi:MAG: zinc ribbon domain-containing protein [Thermodesulfobacteriota bacterium]|nr:zinc ribbon domain-containing protein [Thermodesulfobacteriota bacterium]
MKKCPYCAEDIQDAAIKCKHCGEFLDDARRVRAETEKQAWYFRTSFIVIAILCVGPLALPLIWWRPRTSMPWKIGLTIVILVLSWILFQVTLQSVRTLTEYYRLLDSI